MDDMIQNLQTTLTPSTPKPNDSKLAKAFGRKLERSRVQHESWGSGLRDSSLT